MNLTSLSACITMNEEYSVQMSGYAQDRQTKYEDNLTKGLIIQKEG